MTTPRFFVKSFEDDFVLKTLIGKSKVPSQSVQEIVSTREIKPNTISFGKKKRLSVTILHPAYTRTYRPQGLIFQTTITPDFVIPFDLVLCSDAERMVVQYYRIKNNLHAFYNRTLIPGYERFIFKDMDKMIRSFPNPQAAWKAVNEFRVKHGLSRLPAEKFRLAMYNEAVFQRPIKITPVAIFGYRPEARRMARELGIPYFRSARDFVKTNVRRGVISPGRLAKIKPLKKMKRRRRK